MTGSDLPVEMASWWEEVDCVGTDIYVIADSSQAYKSINIQSSGGNGPDAHNGAKFAVRLTNPYKFTF